MIRALLGVLYGLVAPWKPPTYDEHYPWLEFEE